MKEALTFTFETAGVFFVENNARQPTSSIDYLGLNAVTSVQNAATSGSFSPGTCVRSMNVILA